MSSSNLSPSGQYHCYLLQLLLILSVSQVLPSAQRAFSQTFLDDIASHQYDDAKMQATLSEGTYAAYKASIADGTPLEKDARNELASAMAKFAYDLGATTYCHKYVQKFFVYFAKLLTSI